jgi:ubiquinol-cytochrome c reductase iron-sulfur subunit
VSEITDINKDPSNPQDEQLDDEERRQFLLTTTKVIGGIGAACTLVPLTASWLPSSKAQAAGAPIKVDLSRMQPGEQAIIEWRGKPVWIIKRSKEMLEQLQAEDETQLRDPESLVEQQPAYAQNKHRSIKPEYLVLIGICTHLGCSPKYKPSLGELGPNWPGGFFCPCHGSTFDLSGRVFKGVPAPINLEVPPYYFIDENTILIGEDGNKG